MVYVERYQHIRNPCFLANSGLILGSTAVDTLSDVFFVFGPLDKVLPVWNYILRVDVQIKQRCWLGVLDSTLYQTFLHSWTNIHQMMIFMTSVSLTCNDLASIFDDISRGM